MHARYDWLLLDADGTLFDFDRAAAAAFRQTCHDLLGHCDPAYAPIYEQQNRRVWREFETGRIDAARLRIRRFELFIAATGVRADAGAFSRGYLGHLAAHADLLDGAATVVAQLAAIARLMMITNGLQEVQRARFARSPISRHFAGFVISEEVGAAKPDPAIFDAAFGLMGRPDRSAVLIVGDSLTSDIKGGHDYGIDTCWFNPDHRPRRPQVPVSFEIDRLEDLVKIVATT